MVDGITGVCGWITKLPNPATAPTTSYDMMVCPSDTNGAPLASPTLKPWGSCTANSTIASTLSGGPGGYSYYEFDRSLFVPNQKYYIYAWKDAEHYGNSNMPVGYFFGPPSQTDCRQYSGSACGVYGANGEVEPAPLPVSAVFPANNQQDVSQSFTLKWTTGKDTTRAPWTASYDVYGHGMGASDTLEAQNAPCNPDASGNCQLTISGAKSNSYMFWHVVAKFPSSYSWTSQYITTASDQFTFTTLTLQSVPVSFATNDWLHYLTSYSCGGSSMLATATSQGSCESYKVINLTPHSDNDIYSGDTVALQQSSSGGYYVTAMLGGGDNVMVTGTSPGDWQKFTITKLSSPWSTPGTRIMNQDRMAFTSIGGYYLNAYNGGGGAVDACNHPDGSGGSEACTANTTFSANNQTLIYLVH